MRLDSVKLRPADTPEEPDTCSLDSRMVVIGPAVGSLAKRDLAGETVIDLDPKDWKHEDDDFDTPGEKRLTETVDFIFCYFFGADHGQGKPGCESSKARLRKRLKEKLRLDTLEEASDDLDTALEHLESTLFLMERYLGRYPQLLLSSEFTEQMETIAEYIENWGLGQHTDEQHNSILTDVIRRET